MEGVGGGDADGVVNWGRFFRGRNLMRKGPSMIRRKVLSVSILY